MVLKRKGKRIPTPEDVKVRSLERNKRKQSKKIKDCGGSKSLLQQRKEKEDEDVKESRGKLGLECRNVRVNGKQVNYREKNWILAATIRWNNAGYRVCVCVCVCVCLDSIHTSKVNSNSD